MPIDQLSKRELTAADNQPYLPPILSLLPSAFHDEDECNNQAQASYTSNRLPAIDQSSLFLYKALFQFRPIRRDYAVASYAESFNWQHLQLPSELEAEW